MKPTDSKGHTILIGDYVLLPNGQTIEVKGLAVRTFKASECTIVAVNNKNVTNTPDYTDTVSYDGDTVIWGT